MKISFILATRNDGFGGRSQLKRLQTTISSIKRLPVNKEIVLVEFCPHGKFLPDYQDVRKITVPDEVETVLSNDLGRLFGFHEYLAKDIGAQMSTGDYLVFCNPDCIFPVKGFRDVMTKLINNIFVRAIRQDVDVDDNFDPEGLIELAENNQLEISGVYGCAAGDFSGMSRDIYFRLGGYKMVHGAWAVDDDLIQRALSVAISIDNEYRHYHLSHPSSDLINEHKEVEQYHKILPSSLMEISSIMKIPPIPPIERLFRQAVSSTTDINAHLEILRHYGSQCERITEFGVRYAQSTLAWLASRPKKLTCYDINTPPTINVLKELAGLIGLDFSFFKANSSEVSVSPTDLLFLDTLHNYEHVSKELYNNFGRVSKYIIIHDSEACGWRGDNGKDGIKKVLIEFLLKFPEWRVEKHYPFLNGLTILAKGDQSTQPTLLVPYYAAGNTRTVPFVGG